MIKRDIDINTVLAKLDSCDSKSIRQVLRFIKYSDSIGVAAIQHELKIEYMQASKLLDLFIDAGILKKINNSIPGDSGNENYYEASIPKSKLAELSAILDIEEQLNGYAADRNMTQTVNALAFIRQKQAWQKEKKEGYFNISPLAMAHNAFVNMGIQDDDSIATILLQNMAECYGISLEELPVTDKVRNSISLLTFYVNSEETEEIAKKRYYDKLSEDREATLTVLADKLHNFPQDRTEQYAKNAKEHIKEVREYIMPLIDKAKKMYPSDTKAFSYLEEHITSVVESMDLIVRILERGFRKS